MPRDETLERLLDSARVTLGESLRKVDRLQEFSDSLRELLRDLAGKPQLRERDQLLEKLQNWIVDARKIGEGQLRPSPLQLVRNVTLQAFGSSVMGISGRGGDLDISLEGEVLDEAVSPSGHLADASRMFKGDLLGEVHACLRHGNHFRSSKHTHLIRQAKVPVSKFVEMSTGIHCDLSIGNSSGVFKSQLLAEVLKMDSRVRELVVIVKKWARANNMNDPTCGSFNSYCLTLLVISFSQTRKPPLLPPFKDLFPGLRGILIDNGKPGSPSLCTLIEKYQKTVNDWVEDHKNDSEKNTETLCELLMGFLVSLSLYATHSQLMHYTAEGISKSTIRPTASPWEGGFISTGWEAKALKKYQLFVEDPFEAKDNCARTLATQDWWRICKTLQETVVAMEDFIHARSNMALYKWQDLWMVLFQRPSPGPFQMINSGGWREGSPEAESSPEERTAMIRLHRDALIEHLRRFKMSDKRFIAVSDSWWSREFKVYVMSAVDEMGLFRGDGPKKKLLISKDSDIKEALVEHAVNSTLRARKNQSTIIDPYDCVVKQRLREFLKCSLRYHVFHAAAFRKEIKDWVLKCVEEVGLGGEFMDSGDLRVERSADFRPPPSITINGCHRIPYSAFVCSQDVFKVIDPQDTVCQNGAGDSEKLSLVEQVEDDQETGVGDSQQEDAPVTDPEELLSSDELEEVILRTEGGSSDVDEKSPSVNEASSSSEVTTIPSSSLDVIGASVDSDLPLRGVEFLENGVEDVETSGLSESPRPPSDPPVVDSAELGPSLSTGVGGENDLSGGAVSVAIRCEGDCAALCLTYCDGQRNEKTRIRRPDILGLDYTNRVFKDVGLFPTASGQPEELLTPTIRKPPQEITIPAAGSPSKMNPEQHQRNAEILRHVFFDLFRRLEELKESECIMGEVQIDPTEFVVPVAWVRQQVRDIARNLFLEVVPMNGKKRRAMKIRVRKRRFDDSETDSEDFNRHMYRMSPQKRQARGMERVNLIRRGSDRLMGTFPLAPWPVPDDDQKDHVTHCLQWVKKQKRPFEFWTEIYPGDVQQGLRERAEELGLTVDINMDKMYLGVDHNPRRQNTQRFQTVCSHVLNEEVQLAIRRYLQQRMNQMLVEGKDNIQLPCKGFFMRPRWVTEEAMRIGGALGLEIVDMKDKVEVINSNKLAERQRLLQLLQQQQSNFVQKHQFSPPPMMPEGSGGSFGQHMGRQMRQPMLQRTLSGGHRYPCMEAQNGHSSMLSAAQNILQMSQSSSFNSQPSPMMSGNTPPPPSNGMVLGSTEGNGEATHPSERPHSNGMRGSPAPESFMRQLRGEGAMNSRNGNECNARHGSPAGSGGGGNGGGGGGAPWPQPRKGGRGHGRGNRRYESKREGLPPRGGNETESQPPSRGRRGRGARRNRNG